jgi:hypothetical protein
MNLNVEMTQEIWIDGRQVDTVVLDKKWLEDNANG